SMALVNALYLCLRRRVGDDATKDPCHLTECGIISPLNERGFVEAMSQLGQVHIAAEQECLSPKEAHGAATCAATASDRTVADYSRNLEGPVCLLVVH